MQGHSKTFEDGLRQVMIVISRHLANVSGNPTVVAKGHEELPDILGREFADLWTRERNVEEEMPASANIQSDEHKGLIHRRVVARVANNVIAFQQSQSKRLAHHDADIFHRMMIVDGEVSFRGDADIEVAMEGHEAKHMIEEGDSGADVSPRAAVEVEDDLDARFRSLPLALCIPNPRRPFAHHLFIPPRGKQAFPGSQGTMGIMLVGFAKAEQVIVKPCEEFPVSESVPPGLRFGTQLLE